MKSSIGDSETVQLSFKEEKSNIEESIKLNSGKINGITELLISNRSELDVTMAEVIHEQQELESNRNLLFKDIEPSFLDAYEKLRNARQVGMVSIIGSACGGCYSQLPPQPIIEIKENKDILTCPNCSVLLFWDGVEEF